MAHGDERAVTAATDFSDPHQPPPDDVMTWLRETYTPEGVEIWLAQWWNVEVEVREHMVRMARTDPMGT